MRVFAAGAQLAYAHVHPLIHVQGRVPFKERQRGIIAQNARRHVQPEFVYQSLRKQGKRKFAASFTEEIEACVILP